MYLFARLVIASNLTNEIQELRNQLEVEKCDRKLLTQANNIDTKYCNI